MIDFTRSKSCLS